MTDTSNLKKRFAEETIHHVDQPLETSTKGVSSFLKSQLGHRKNQEQQVPLNLYVICHDPYGQNQSADSTSLGAAYVLKRPNNLSHPDDIIVASYVGRPNTQDDYNRNLFMLADYYG